MSDKATITAAMNGGWARNLAAKLQEPSSLAPAQCSTDPTHDAAYQAFVDECAKHCVCERPHPCPCDGVLAGGLCDEMTNEPDFTMDDLDWHEAYE